MSRIAACLDTTRVSRPYLRLHGLTSLAVSAVIGLGWAAGDGFLVAVGIGILVCNEIWALRRAVECQGRALA